MYPYFLLFTVPFIYYASGYLRNKDTKVLSKNTIMIYCVIIFTLMCLRADSVGGNDLVNYKVRFQLAMNYSWKDILFMPDIEKGYTLLNKFISVFTNNFRFVLVFVAFVNVIAVYRLYSNAGKPLLIIAAYTYFDIFFLSWAGLRQSLALSFCVLSYGYIKKKKLVPVILITLIAMTFHLSALCNLVVYFAYHYKCRKRQLIVIFPMVILIWIFRVNIFSIIMSFNPVERYQKYVDIVNTGAYRTLILYILLYLFSIIVVKGENKEAARLSSILLLSIVLQIFTSVSHIVSRFAYYPLVYLPILMPKMILSARVRYKQIANLAEVALIVLFMFMFFYNAYFGTDDIKVFPYVFMWD